MLASTKITALDFQQQQGDNQCQHVPSPSASEEQQHLIALLVFHQQLSKSQMHHFPSLTPAKDSSNFQVILPFHHQADQISNSSKQSLPATRFSIHSRPMHCISVHSTHRLHLAPVASIWHHGSLSFALSLHLSNP
ncbi:hypothetical protein Nepgr_007924 [Nepenthes gracilis]|uniref:Uncharacterized protein n=1 Tax=Nepenthes gracilis TaxID=150966 RepID=A0AAD3S852_NEPGR|nr:hypothetical protein Nepgr_007924 [Nepenthes gracilis]